MAIIETRIDRSNPEFATNTRYFQNLLDQLSQRIQRVHQGGGDEAIAKHRKRNKFYLIILIFFVLQILFLLD